MMQMIQEKKIRLMILFVAAMLFIGLTGCSSWSKKQDATAPFARVTPVPDNRDVPDELLFPKEIELKQNHALRGDIRLTKGDFAGAFVQYDKHLADHQDDFQVQHKKGLALMMGRQYDEAIKVFEAVLIQNPQYTHSHHALAQACFEIGDLDKSEQHLQKAIELDPERWGAHNLLGNIHDRRKNYDLAIEAYQQAIRLAPSKGNLHNNLGVSYLLVKNYPEAAGSLEKAIQLGVRDKRVHNNLGLAYAGMDQPQRALRAFKRGGSAPQAYNNLGCIYMQQGKYALAIEAFEKAVVMSPQFYSKASSNLRNAQAMLARKVN
jgi:Flp pilus assembly protein TadD